MKSITNFGMAALFVASLTSSALANGQGSPVEPAPMPAPTQLEPAGPAPAATVEKTQSSQNWWLIALAAVIIIAIIIIASDDDDDDGEIDPGS